MPSVPSPSYDDALAYWYGRVNYELRNPRPGDLKLDRMRALLRLLGDPQEALSIVHVAGSKGKGSTAAMLASILTRSGRRTGLFTSPHLCRVEERIQIDDQPISAEELTSLLDEVRRRLRQAPELETTFFEMATALGFLHFLRRGVDAAVIEVGLGGRFDSTNVCRPLLSVITSISHDHTQQLGDRLSSIAFEKAGIIKPGRPVVSGVTAPEARAVIERVARERGSPLRQLGVDFRYECVPGQVTHDATVLPAVRVDPGPGRWMELGLLGEHQAANAAVAVATIDVLRTEGWPISDAAVTAGLGQVRWPARLEVLGRRPLVVLDCAHNVASAEALVATLNSSFPPARRWLIFAASADKDLSGMLGVLAPHFAHAFMTRYAGSARGMAPEDLAALLRRGVELPHSICPTARDAWQAARERAGPDDLICITGSVFLAGELRPMLLSPDMANGGRKPPE
jgi:dihydrofolate synthase/folylpolyglutamate synthase